MRRLALLTAAVLLLLAQPALAARNFDGGQGTYGPTDDKIVTNVGFFLIAAFPLLILCLSMLQWRLDKRKDMRKAAAESREDWDGGW